MSSRGGIQHTDSCGLADRHRELERQGDRAGGGGGDMGRGQSFHLPRESWCHGPLWFYKLWSREREAEKN